MRSGDPDKRVAALLWAQQEGTRMVIINDALTTPERYSCFYCREEFELRGAWVDGFAVCDHEGLVFTKAAVCPECAVTHRLDLRRREEAHAAWMSGVWGVRGLLVRVRGHHVPVRCRVKSATCNRRRRVPSRRVARRG